MRVYACRVPLTDDLGRIAAAAAEFAGPAEKVTGIISTESGEGQRLYLCAFAGAGGETSWLALDDAGEPVQERAVVRAAVSIAALCELAEETAGGGDLDELRAQLVALRLTEDPPGIAAAEEAVGQLQEAIGMLPRVASPAHLDAVGVATRRLEQALGEPGASPFAEAMRSGIYAVESLTAEVERGFKRRLS